MTNFLSITGLSIVLTCAAVRGQPTTRLARPPTTYYIANDDHTDYVWTANADTIENAAVSVTLDKDGAIRGLIDKSDGEPLAATSPTIPAGSTSDDSRVPIFVRSVVPSAKVLSACRHSRSRGPLPETPAAATGAAG